MKASIEKVTITLDRREAVQIYDAINKHVGMAVHTEYRDHAIGDLQELLRSLFESSKTGVHVPTSHRRPGHDN